MVTSSSPSLCGWQLVVMQNIHSGRLLCCFGFYLTAMERYYLYQGHFLVRCHSVLILLFVCSSCALHSTHSHSNSHYGNKDGSRRIMSPPIHENVGGGASRTPRVACLPLSFRRGWWWVPFSLIRSTFIAAE